MNANTQTQNPHPSMTRTYLNVFGLLAALTALTVGASYIHFSSRALAIGVGLAIAAVKVTLIGMFFMHLKFEKKLIHVFIYAALFLLLVLLFLILPDIGF